LGIKEEKKPQPKPEGTAVQGSFAEAFSKATLQAAKSMPPTEEIIRDPFCLVLRQQKSESAGAVV